MSEEARRASAAGVEASRPAFYALGPGGWRDYWTLLHPPYTIWHLSYVAIGAAVAPSLDGLRLAASVTAFFLAVGLSAHALDELSGRPLRTLIPSSVLWAVTAFGLAGALALGALGALEVSLWMIGFMAFGTFTLLAYNLELFGGRFHGDLWFALAWGAFPALTGYFAQAGTVRAEAILIAGACLALSLAQRTLSTPVRTLRRRVRRVVGHLTLADGSREALDDRALRAPPERALRALAAAVALLAAGLVSARLWS